MWLKNGTLNVRFQDGDSDATMAISGIQANTEYDVVATFDNDTVNLYLDGELVGTQEFTMDWSSNEEVLQVGGLGWSSATGDDAVSNAFDGTISDVVILDEVFTPTEYDYFA
jgi:concanavalin A-like lectin/glucanase superfamily protein